MKLVAVTHYRCGEYDGMTYLLAPDDITEDKFDDDVETAMKNHLKAIDDFKSSEPAPSGLYRDRIVDFPDDMTISEAKKKIEEIKKKQKEYEDKKRKAVRSFGAYMEDLGYEILSWSSMEDRSFFTGTVWWGHRHGDPLNYECMEADYHPFKEENKVRAIGRIKKVESEKPKGT
jgi:hypothetical protein